ncbi:unnamed protein product [Discula destructiva]
MKIESTLRVLAQLFFFAGPAWSVATTNSTTTQGTISALLSDGYVDLGDAETAYQSAKTFVAGLTNAQKISIITGESLTGKWTALENKDGAAGINNQFYTTGFAMPNAVVTTWNKTLYEENFKAIGQEFYDDGFNLINGPVSSPLGRVPEGGRQPEGFSPDPYLNGIATGRGIAGMQSAGVVAAARHFLMNEQETNRSSSGTTRYSSNADDKTLHEIYAWPFADAVKAGMMAVMCAMNRVNDTLSCENNALLSGILKMEMGFPGLVFPDVQSQDSAFGSANAGLDYAPGSQYWSELVMEAGILKGNLTQARLDDMAVRSVIGQYYVGLVNGSQPSVVSSTTEYRDVRGDHATLVRQVGAEALVLLKNTNTNGGGLPLNKPKTIALFGSHAGPAVAGPNLPFSVAGTDADIYEGHLATGGGSGELALGYLSTPYQAISAHAYEDRSMIWWIMNNTYTYSGSGFGAGSPGGGGGGGGGGFGGGSPPSKRQNLGGGALGSGTSVTPSYANYATNAEVCLCFINAASGEGADRASLLDTDQDTMILTVAETCNNTVVVVNVAGPRVIGAWADHENVTAILYSGLLGEESGNAIADVLYGDVNPSGKLAYTLVQNETDYPISICDTSDCDFSEGVYLDYRYFAANNISVLYPFGHGLSYTSFTYAPTLAVSTNATALAARYPSGALAVGGYADLWDDVVSVTASVANTGARAGQEVVQLYLSFPAEAAQPPRILRGFEKVSIAAGASADVDMSLRRRDVSFWDVAAQQWAVASGTYTVSVGASSEDLKATATFTV